MGPAGSISGCAQAELPRQEAEHQTFHRACDVFRHRKIYVDTEATCRCVATHTISR
jgi:hypothetical protein